MKSLYTILLIPLMTSAISAQYKNVQPHQSAQSRASTGRAISGYLLRGKVTDLITGGGIGAATIEVVDSHRNLHTTLSSPDGTYRLEHLPKEQSLVVRCSQLGYDPNPKVETARFKDGMATWNPQLVQENADAVYLRKAAQYLAALPPRQRVSDAMYISVNLSPASRSVVAAELKEKSRALGGNNNLTKAEAFFTPGPASDKQIRQAVVKAVKQSDPQNQYRIKFIKPVRIEVLNGHVKLAGVVSSQAGRNLIYKWAAEVPSASHIENNVKVLNQPHVH